MIKIAVLASGSGTNAENIIRFFSGSKEICVDVVVSNKIDAYVHERAKSLRIDSFTFEKQDFLEAGKIVELLKKRNIDFIVLAGFLLKIPKLLIDSFDGRIINIHPALLPKYGGKGMYGDNVHKAVVEARDKETGITIHYVNENYDEGNIIFQAKCRVLPNDSASDVARKVHELEYKYFPKIIDGVVRQTFCIKDK